MEIIPGYRSDHSTITLELIFDNLKRGRGIWKFNNTLIKDETYKKKVIHKHKLMYAVPLYNIQNVDTIP